MCALTSLAITLGAIVQARAQEYCVACTQPDAVYRCVIVDARRAKGQPLPVFCTSTLARLGGHAACNVRGGTVFDCDAPVKRIGDPRPAAIDAPAGKASEPSAAPGRDAKDKGAQKEPGTVQALAREAVKSSSEQAGKMGEATRKAWKCVTSLFTSC
jgi:hypothetical protein